MTRWPDQLVRFLANVDRTPGQGPWGNCHRWTGTPHGEGYGTVYFNGRQHLAHRVAFYLKFDRWPKGHGHHRCEMRWCVNADHVEDKDPGQHTSDHASGRTHCLRNHPYTPENTYINRDGYRSCKTCRREAARASKARKKANATQDNHTARLDVHGRR